MLKADNLRAWFSAGVACVGMGSKLVRSEWVQAGNYQASTDLTKQTLDVIHAIRGRS